jgi:predicted TIM-barrel fold metal-dependent hydrolase
MSSERVIPWTNLPVIDAHTHAFSPDRIAKRAQLALRDRWFGELYSNPISKLVDAYDLASSSRDAGIERTVICGFPWSDEGLCREENAYLAEVCEKSEGRLSWLGIVVPGHETAAADADWCFANGAVGLGEFNSDGQSAPLESREHWQDVIEVAHNANRPVLLHASEGVGHRYPGKGTATPERLINWLELFPDIDVVLAHWGGGLPFFELMPEVRRLTSRVTYDCAASTYLYDFKVFPRVIDLAGADRVLWGSDYPVLGQARFLAKSRQTLRDEPEAGSVLSINAERVYTLAAIEGS